jgi:hypothetical protein
MAFIVARNRSTAPQGAAPPSNPSAIVSGAGSVINDEYTPRGTFNGKPYYNLVGQPDSTDNNAVKYSGANWVITASDGSALYGSSVNSFAFPWLSVSWSVLDGDSPAPGVASSETTVVVSGAGTPAADGVYSFNGYDSNGQLFYTLAGHVPDPDSHLFSVFFDNGNGYWAIRGALVFLYVSSDAPAFPYLATWTVGGDGEGDSPAPTVTAS